MKSVVLMERSALRYQLGVEIITVNESICDEIIPSLRSASCGHFSSVSSNARVPAAAYSKRQRLNAE